MLGPRQADGSVPNVNFLKLAAGSQMIDKGTDVGLPYAGQAPDLGAYEYGAATIVKALPQTAFSKNITVTTGAMPKLEGFARSKSAVTDGRTALFTITGQRIYPNNSGAMSIPGIYIEKRLTD